MAEPKPGFVFRDLDQLTRYYMVEEIDRATRDKQHYHSTRLTAAGLEMWATLLREAVQAQDEQWLAGCLVAQKLFKDHDKDGKRISPEVAARLLADQHFKRFYLAAICRRAMDMHQAYVWVYRARESEEHRPGSDALVGQARDASALLREMRDLNRMHKNELQRQGSGLAVTLTPASTA